MPSNDEPQSLRADIVRRWKEELFSADTVVAAVSVIVAFPTAYAAWQFVSPVALSPVLFAVSVGPSLGYWQGVRIEVEPGTAVAVGLAMALATAVVTTAVVALAMVFDAGPEVALVVSGVAGLLFAGLASRYAFHRLAGETA